MKLTINLATRNRPEALRRTLDMTLANIREPDTTLMVSCDEDDAAGIAVAEQYKDGVMVSIKPREDSLGAKYNRALTAAPADIYLAMVDYAPHVTPGFDTKICEAASLFPDGIGVVYNHMANLSFPVINAVTHGLAKQMGFIYPPYFPYWFVDHWLDDIARMIGRIAVADVTVDTTHRPGTMDRREPGFWSLLFDAGVVIRRECARNIIESAEFQEPAWRKKMLLGSLNLVEERSLMVNQYVRATASQMGPGPAPDERYARIKAAGAELLSVWAGIFHLTHPDPGVRKLWSELAALRQDKRDAA